MKRASIFLLVTGYRLLVTNCIFADTIYTNDGKELKGIIVEDYKDRVIFSTSEGEIVVMKEDVRELYYDNEEENLIKLAEQAKERSDYIRAFAYYDRAYKLNPKSKAAKDGLVFLQGYLFRQEQAKKEGEINRRSEMEQPSAGWKEEAPEVPRVTLRKEIGIALAGGEVFPKVEDLVVNSPAYEAGIRKGDSLVAVWGRLTGYLRQNEIIDILLEKSAMEIKCMIERPISVDVNRGSRAISADDLIGASFTMELDGLTVKGIREGGSSEAAGLKEQDKIISISGTATRYLALKKAIDLLKISRGRMVEIIIRREVIIWRKG